MTTGSLTVLETKTKSERTYWIWHDGYQIEKFLEEAEKRNPVKKFTMETIENLVLGDLENDFELWNRNGVGDWHWTLVILDENNVVITGAGNDDIRTAYWEV